MITATLKPTLKVIGLEFTWKCGTERVSVKLKQKEKLVGLCSDVSNGIKWVYLIQKPSNWKIRQVSIRSPEIWTKVQQRGGKIPRISTCFSYFIIKMAPVPRPCLWIIITWAILETTFIIMCIKFSRSYIM